MGVVIKEGRTRVRVERGEVRWQTGRTTTVVPGPWISRVDVDPGSGPGTLTLHLLAGPHPPAAPLTVRHRSHQALAGLAAEMTALRPTYPPYGTRPPVRRETTEPWPVPAVRSAAGRLTGVLRHGTFPQKSAAFYTLFGLPVALLALLLPGAPRWHAPAAWAAGLFGGYLLTLFEHALDLRTRWILRRRGVTVQVPNPPEVFRDSEGAGSYLYRFRTLDGVTCRHRSGWKARRGELRYDPEDPSRVLASSWGALPVGLLLGVPMFAVPGVVCAAMPLVWVGEAVTALF
ncbi:hypothetical protein [Streptomyces eurocidicus]|uniref:Uncharacterized protein n=1 Tax=Streptomyces eurocidicus TaxID=66423 RepID=A0A7W8F323_STREU|nr:hypothetical protein [Streptomyces eurocidicus]MBB5121323.1 hypothetical protein [Streptomyces eurocidicus]MBF6055928.1 hypothetical protein [Streptomyces eurocidicus]